MCISERQLVARSAPIRLQCCSVNKGLAQIQDFLERYFINPRWRTIRFLGQAKILGISATTLLVAPLLSRTLVKIEGMRSSLEESPLLKTLYPLIDFHLRLPWSIKFVVLSAIFALAGKALYSMTCPRYLNTGDTYESFRQSQSDASAVLAGAFLKFMMTEVTERKGELVAQFGRFGRTFQKPDNLPKFEGWTLETPLSVYFTDKPGAAAGSTLTQAFHHPEIAGPMFYTLRDVMDDSRRGWRLAVAYTYYVAIGFLLCALSMQAYWIVKALWL